MEGVYVERMLNFQIIAGKVIDKICRESVGGRMKLY